MGVEEVAWEMGKRTAWARMVIRPGPADQPSSRATSAWQCLTISLSPRWQDWTSTRNTMLKKARRVKQRPLNAVGARGQETLIRSSPAERLIRVHSASLTPSLRRHVASLLPQTPHRAAA
jgi:hypothetical protein